MGLRYRQSGSDRLAKQPTDLRQSTCYFGDRTLASHRGYPRPHSTSSQRGISRFVTGGRRQRDRRPYRISSDSIKSEIKSCALRRRLGRQYRDERILRGQNKRPHTLSCQQITLHSEKIAKCNLLLQIGAISRRFDYGCLANDTCWLNLFNKTVFFLTNNR